MTRARARCPSCDSWKALRGPLCDDCDPHAVKVVPRSLRSPCRDCGHAHVTTARLPWCDASRARAVEQAPTGRERD